MTKCGLIFIPVRDISFSRGGSRGSNLCAVFFFRFCFLSEKTLSTGGGGKRTLPEKWSPPRQSGSNFVPIHCPHISPSGHRKRPFC